jgi:hypothetical protein
MSATERALDRQARAGQGDLDRATRLQIAAMNNKGGPNAPSPSEIKYSLQQVNIVHSVANMIQYAEAHKIKNMRKILLDRGYSGPQIEAGLSLYRYGRIKNPSVVKQLGILPQHRG